MFHRPYFKYIPEMLKRLETGLSCNSDINFIYLVSGVHSGEESNLVLNSKDISSLIYYDKKRSSEARNIIINKTNSTWVGFIDGDCLPPENYSQKLEEIIREEGNNKEIGAFTGIFSPIEESRFGKYEYLEDIEAYNYFLDSNPNFIKLIFGGNCLLRRELLKKIGNFDENIPVGVDRELAARIIKEGYKIRLRSDLSVFCRYNQSLREILKRKWFHGSGMAKVYSMHGDVLGRWGMKNWAKFFAEASIMPPKRYRKGFDPRFYYWITSWTYGVSVLSHARKFV